MSDRDAAASSYRWGKIFAWAFLVAVVLLFFAYFGVPFTSIQGPLRDQFGSGSTPSSTAGYGPPSSGSVAIVSSSQGAEDAETAETPISPSVDRQRCYDRLLARRMRPDEATQVCEKVIGALYN